MKLAVAALGLVSLTPGAFAEVKTAAPDALVIEHHAEIVMTKEALWSRLVKPAAWWSSDHTYSHSAANLSLKPVAGGCWCEIWKGGEVEHGRVIVAMPGELLRLDAALGPLQGLGVKGVLSVEISGAKTAGRINVTMTYVVVGSSASKLDSLAGPVDGVLAEQFSHLIGAPPGKS